MKRGNKMNESSNAIKEGVLFLGIYFLLILSTLFIPFVGLLTVFLLPIPFILFGKKYGLKPSLYLLLVSFVLLLILAYPLAIIFTITFASTGVVIGELYRREKPAFAVLLGGSLTVITALIVNFIGSIVLLDIHPIRAVQDVLTDSVEQTESLLAVFGDQQATFEAAQELIDQLIVITPSLFILIGVAFAFIVQWLASITARMLKSEVSTFPPLREWSFPKAFIWYYLIMYIFILIGVDEGTTMYTIVYNLFPILEMVMVIQGLALIFFFFHKKKIHIAVPISILFLSVLFPFMLYLVRILGIIDLGFELRKRLDSNK